MLYERQKLSNEESINFYTVISYITIPCFDLPVTLTFNIKLHVLANVAAVKNVIVYCYVCMCLRGKNYGADHDLFEIMDAILAILHLAGSIKDVSPQHRYDIVQTPSPSFLLLFFWIMRYITKLVPFNNK